MIFFDNYEVIIPKNIALILGSFMMYGEASIASKCSGGLCFGTSRV